MSEDGRARRDALVLDDVAVLLHGLGGDHGLDAGVDAVGRGVDEGGGGADGVGERGGLDERDGAVHQRGGSVGKAKAWVGGRVDGASRGGCQCQGEDDLGNETRLIIRSYRRDLSNVPIYCSHI